MKRLILWDVNEETKEKTCVHIMEFEDKTAISEIQGEAILYNQAYPSMNIQYQIDQVNDDGSIHTIKGNLISPSDNQEENDNSVTGKRIGYHLQEAAKLLYPNKKYTVIELVDALNRGIEGIKNPVLMRKTHEEIIRETWPDLAERIIELTKKDRRSFEVLGDAASGETYLQSTELECPHCILMGAFIFGDTFEGDEYWCDVSKKAEKEH